MENLEPQILDISKIKIIPSDTEIPVHDNSILTKRALCSNFPENSVILDQTEAIVKVITDISEDLEENEQECVNNIPEYIDELQAVFNPLNTEECSSDIFENGNYEVIDNINDLKKYLSELLIRFDTSPRNYTKEDYLFLLGILYKSLIYIYTKETLSLGPNLSKIAYNRNSFLELKYPVAVKNSIVTHPSETIPSVDYLNNYYVLRWEEF